jgi:perosamine synthetase
MTNSDLTVYDCFKAREVYYTHKCRTVLRKVCELLELGADNEVVVPAYNCGSEVDVFSKAGVSLQPYRVEETTEIDWEDFVGRMTRRTRAALVTHYFGFPQAISRVVQICKEKRIWLIEDCAHALFSRDRKRMLGSLGDIAVFSFSKTLGVPDGGRWQ